MAAKAKQQKDLQDSEETEEEGEEPTFREKLELTLFLIVEVLCLLLFLDFLFFKIYVK